MIIDNEWYSTEPGETTMPATTYYLAIENFPALHPRSSIVLTIGIEFGFSNSEKLNPTYPGEGCLVILWIA